MRLDPGALTKNTFVWLNWSQNYEEILVVDHATYGLSGTLPSG